MELLIIWLRLWLVFYVDQIVAQELPEENNTADKNSFFLKGTFTNNYGYGPFGLGPSNSGFDSFGYWKTKYTNSGLNPLYTWQSYRNYYGEFAVHNNRYNNPAPADFENLQEERFGPYYNGIWGYIDHSPYWNG